MLEVVPSRLYAAPHWLAGHEVLRVHLHVNVENRAAEVQELRRLRLETFSGAELVARVELEPYALRRAFRPTPWRVVQTRQDLALARRLARHRHPVATDLTVAAGRGAALVDLGRRLQVDEATDRLRVTLWSNAGAPAVREVKIHHHHQHVALRLPVKGRWKVLAAYDSREPHASLDLLSQSYAYDLTKVAAGDLTFNGNPRDNASYPAFDQPVLAMADGVVVALNDGVPDNTPGQGPDWQALLRRPSDLGGNYVVIDHGKGEHSASMHLRPGLKLRIGDRVRCGAPIGRCGNSGNSYEPHLHIQLQDGRDPLRAMGLPMRIGDFTFYYGHRALYVGAPSPHPLPWRLPFEAGRRTGATAESGAARQPLP